MPRLDRGDISCAIFELASFHFAGPAVALGIGLVAFAHQSPRPLTGSIRRKTADTFVAGCQEFRRPALSGFKWPEVVNDMKAFVDDLWRPAVTEGIFRDFEGKDTNRAVHPIILGSAISPQEWRNNKLRLARSGDIH